MAEPDVKRTVTAESAMLKNPLTGNLSLFNLQKTFSGFIFNGIKGFKDEKKQIDIKAINWLLFILTFCLTLYYLNGIAGSLKKIKNIDLGNFISTKDIASASVKEASSLKPFSYYLESFKKRDIFRMGQKSPTDNTGAISSKAAEASQNLRLVGISWSDQPDVMIEDTKAAKTYFVKKGQMVGDFRVESVYKDKVVLRYGAESIDLR
jgi:hypothetical protein